MLDPRTPYTFRAKGYKFCDVVIRACMDEKKRLCFFDYERGHMLDGKTKKQLKSGIVFKSAALGEVTLKPLTMDEFDTIVRPSIDEHLSQYLNDLDDVYTWYRKLAGIT